MTELAAEVDYVAVATRMVRSILGGRWTWPPVEVRDLYAIRGGQRVIQLRGEPIISVLSVKDYETGDSFEFTRLGGSRIELAAGARRTCNRVDVVYTYGSKPSALAQRAINALAEQLQLADNDSDECRLPERVTQVNRQGVSWTVFDPFKLLEKGLTGIYEIDLALSLAKPGAKTRPRVWSPDMPPPERLYARRAGDIPTYDMTIEAQVSLELGFRYNVGGEFQSLVGYDFKAEIRASESQAADLIFDLTPYMEIDEDGIVRLYVPGSVTDTMDPDLFVDTASWDLFVWPIGQQDDAFPIVQGSVTFDPATTDLP